VPAETGSVAFSPHAVSSAAAAVSAMSVDGERGRDVMRAILSGLYPVTICSAL
jgi:hypothetical protein